MSVSRHPLAWPAGWARAARGGGYPILAQLRGAPRRWDAALADRGGPLRARGPAERLRLRHLHQREVRAIGLTVAPLRAIERQGATAMRARAWHAFGALPANIGSIGARRGPIDNAAAVDIRKVDELWFIDRRAGGAA